MGNLKKILDFIKKTGDKVIIVSEFSDPFVIMTFDQYEQLIFDKRELGLMSEQEILDKANKDFVSWKESQRKGEENLNLKAGLEDVSETELEVDNKELEYKNIPPPPPLNSHYTDLSDDLVEETDEFIDEDKFYLEPL